MPNLLLCYWSGQLFDLRAPSSTDVLVLLLNQPNVTTVIALAWIKEWTQTNPQACLKLLNLSGPTHAL